MPTINTTLAGCNFRPAPARDICKALNIGDQLALKPDPDNEYDSNAVKVLADDVFIGFVPKADNGAIFAALNRDESVQCEVVGFASSIKPLLEITLT